MLFNFLVIGLMGLDGASSSALLQLKENWYRSLDAHWAFCVSVNFENPLCPQTTSLYEVYSEPKGKLSGENLLLVATALRLKRSSTTWLSTLGLDGKRPESIDPLLWDNARWIYAQTLYDQKAYKESAHLFDDLVETFKGRALFHQQRAWAQFFAGQYDRALGSIVSAESPLIPEVPFPRKYLLRALIERETCQYEKAFRTIADGRKQLGEKKVDASTALWVRQCEAKSGGGLCAKIKDWFQRTLEADVKEALVDLDYLEAEMNQRGLKQQSDLAKKNQAPIVWPYVGEAWADELGYYSVEVHSSCSN